MNILSKVNKGVDLLKTKYLMNFKQKTYLGNKYEIKYLLERNIKSKELIIVFSACTKIGQKARYKYIRTIDEFKCNKLFILDDFGFDGRGAYYLGKDKDFMIEEDVRALINKISDEIRPEKEIYIGSSKGGYSALYFGLERKNNFIIVGAPQYNLGDYLNIPNHRNILEYIMGDCSDDSIDKLNNLMKDKVYLNKNNNNSVHIHYSTEEETYMSDIRPLLEEMKNINMKAYCDKKNYNSHAELTLFFPQYIQSCLKEILDI
ncbi:hypothetical protein R0131_12575 [Clostridium sp. AL.422]|uniref:accessory Sec system protein Asp2 n=1 Tax=Clostridium TaxID=1485 RepID=UPI00293DF9A1|nr:MULTISPECIES: hypothetical protein [unclassified Clostridium]MDV4151660.1 hypothetical protein [Clostridium sp. AL.422]